MIPIDTVRAAVLSDMPWSRLDEIVRAEMASGRKVKEIYDDLNAMLNEVRDTPGLSEDGDDAILDTLDALTGNCRSDQCYYDPPNTSLPSEEEIARLPRWARVAFAARCARRVLPLFQVYAYPSADEHRRAVHDAAKLAGLAAANAFSPAYDTVDRTMYWVQKASGGGPYSDSLGSSAKAAFVADIAAHIAIYASTEGGTSSARRVAMVLVAASSIQNSHTLPVVRRDFDHLARLAQWQRWTDDTPVSPEVFGPLWPEGPPPGWPADPDTPQRTELPLAFVAREGVLPVILEDEVVNLFNALNRYYILRTGDRLTVDGDIHTFLAALQPAGVS